MSAEQTFSIITIVKDDPITGVEYGTVRVPYRTLRPNEIDAYQKHLQAIKSKRMRAEKQKQKIKTL